MHNGQSTEKHVIKGGVPQRLSSQSNLLSTLYQQSSQKHFKVLTIFLVLFLFLLLFFTIIFLLLFFFQIINQIMHSLNKNKLTHM